MQIKEKIFYFLFIADVAYQLSNTYIQLSYEIYTICKMYANLHQLQLW